MAKCTGVRCPMQYGYKAEECNQTDCPYRTEPITNADRIRAMSDEELAKEFVMLAGWDRNEYEKAKRIGIEKVMLDWLKRHAEPPKEGAT